MNLEIIVGSPQPLGLSFQGGRGNFSLFSSSASRVVLGLFKGDHPVKEIPMNQTGDIWHVGIENLPEGLEYAYKCVHEGKSTGWLMDPYAKRVGKVRAIAEPQSPFDWENDVPPNLPKEKLIIYEMHVRGFTQDPSSKTKHPGTFLGLIEKIPYLKKMGINAVELMPVFNFNMSMSNGKKNYWGYSPLNYFAPTNWFGVKDATLEFKKMVRELHKNGIEVILDVVYNHTGEGHAQPSFRGIDKSVYYILNENGEDMNFSGCGNTLNVNHPVVQNLILDSLSYWVEEMHVDGFRFDLASIFSRDQNGEPVVIPPILELMQHDPILSKVKLIAEAWDAAGLYQLGFFPNFGPWSEWNGQYRDIVRRFIKGDHNMAGAFANAVTGSHGLYKKTPTSSINFITAHDGYALKDLVSFQEKHNEANGEENRDGCNHNDSWNCGEEGFTENGEINELRERQLRNFLLALFVSHGVPMLLMGDEAGHTRNGNNNPYCQDNQLNWMLWDQHPSKMQKFVANLIQFRKKNQNLSTDKYFLKNEIQWLNEWKQENSFVSYILKRHSPHLLIAFNAQHLPVKRDLPPGKWGKIIRTDEDWAVHVDPKPFTQITLQPYSALMAVKLP